MIQLSRKGTVYRLSLGKLKIHWSLLKEILRYGVPTAIQNSVISFANLLVQSNVNTFGEVGMASWGAYSKIEGFAFLPIASFSMALSTFIGQNLGAFLSGPEAVAWGVEHCRTVALFYCLLAFSNCIAGVLRGAGFPFALEILSAIPDDSRIAFYNFFSFLLSVFYLPNRL